MKTFSQRFARSIAVLSLTLAAANAGLGHVSAAGARPLAFADFANPLDAKDVSGTADGAVAGVQFKRAISLCCNSDEITLFPHRFPGYTALSFNVGIADTDPDRTGTLVIRVDGAVAKRITKSYGQLAANVVIPFGKSSMIKLVADPDSTQAIDDLVIGDPTLLTTGPVPTSGARPLAYGDFSNPLEAKNISNSPDSTVAGVRYAHAISLPIHAAAISYFTHKYPGYRALTFKVGISDTDQDRTGTLVVTADGKTVRQIAKSYGQGATAVTIPFGQAGIITLTADPNGDQGIESLVIADPALVR